MLLREVRQRDRKTTPSASSSMPGTNFDLTIKIEILWTT